MFGMPVCIQKLQNLCVSCSSYDLQYKSCQRNLMARKKRRVNLTIPTSSILYRKRDNCWFFSSSWSHMFIQYTYTTSLGYIQLIMFLVTADGIYYLHLMNPYFGTQGDFHLWVSGDFHGLEILEPDSDYPVLLTTHKTRSCCFLELRGI